MPFTDSTTRSQTLVTRVATPTPSVNSNPEAFTEGEVRYCNKICPGGGHRGGLCRGGEPDTPLPSRLVPVDQFAGMLTDEGQPAPGCPVVNHA